MGTIDRSTIWPYDECGEPRAFFYQRYGNPTGAEAEARLGELDGGTGVTLQAFERWGLRYVEFDQTGPPPQGVQLVWVEAPSNPFLTMPDLEAAAAHPAPLVVDATVATPILLRPLEHGADFVVHSATKYLAGHDDALLGAVICRDPGAADELRSFRGRAGIVAAPDAAWLLLRGLKTLELRVLRQCATAADIAARLATHPKVETVRYPGLGGLISFDVAGGEAARLVETSTRLIENATSLRHGERHGEQATLGGR